MKLEDNEEQTEYHIENPPHRVLVDLMFKALDDNPNKFLLRISQESPIIYPEEKKVLTYSLQDKSNKNLSDFLGPEILRLEMDNNRIYLISSLFLTKTQNELGYQNLCDLAKFATINMYNAGYSIHNIARN